MLAPELANTQEFVTRRGRSEIAVMPRGLGALRRSTRDLITFHPPRNTGTTAQTRDGLKKSSREAVLHTETTLREPSAHAKRHVDATKRTETGSDTTMFREGAWNHRNVYPHRLPINGMP